MWIDYSTVKKYFDMQEGKKSHWIISSYPGKKVLKMVLIIPSKTRDCEICKDNDLCEDCKLKTKQDKRIRSKFKRIKTKTS